MEILLASDEKGVIRNIIHGEDWKSKMENLTDKIGIPYLPYYDDFEINNALGAHSSK